ncbi:hypothetical protein JCM5350_004181 [Sporobolomyces pararoseus]
MTASPLSEAGENDQVPASPATTPPLENRSSYSTYNSLRGPTSSTQAIPRAFTQIHNATVPEILLETPASDSSAASPTGQSPLSSEIETSSGPCSLSEIVAERWRNSDEATKRRYLSQEADETRASSKQSKEEEEEERIEDDGRMCEVNGRVGESREED